MKEGLALPVYGAFGILLLLLAVEWLPGGEPAIRMPTASHTARSNQAEPDSVARDTASWAASILHRPLFSANRRPAKNAGRAAMAAATGLPRLAGIMITAGGRRAIFMPDNGKAMTLAEGATLDDYTIRRIAPDRVLLSGIKGDKTLSPAYDPSHSGGTTTSGPFQGIGNPGFPQASFSPGFTPPQIPPLGFPRPGVPPPADDSNDENTENQPAAPPAMQPFPGIRGPFIPHGRN